MNSILFQIKEILSCTYGWLLIIVNCIFMFFAPEKASFIVVGLLILADLIWGVLASLKLKKFILSKALRETFKKVNIYSFALAGAYLIELIIHDSGFIGIKVLALLAACCELWSMSASMLIIKPDMPFLRIFRLQLKGEMESKVNKNLDKILKED